MRRLARMFTIVLLAVFAIGTAGNVVGATSMSLEMSAIETGDADMGDCQGCPSDDDGALVCNLPCMVPFLAIISADLAELPATRSEYADSVARESDGHIQPPQPSPPRVTFLS